MDKQALASALSSLSQEEVAELVKSSASQSVATNDFEKAFGAFASKQGTSVDALMKAVTAAGTNQQIFRESLGNIVERVVNDDTPLLNLLAPRAEEIYNLQHRWTADYDNSTTTSELDYDAAVGTITSADVTRNVYTADVALYGVKNTVSNIVDSQITANGGSIMEANRVNHVRKIARDVEKHLFEGDRAVSPKALSGMYAFQQANGNPDLLLNAAGAAVTRDMIEEVIAKMQESAGGAATHIFSGVIDNIDIQKFLLGENPVTGNDKYKYDLFPSSVGLTPPRVVVDAVPSILKKVKATATNVLGALQFTGAVANADTVTIAGITYTAAAAADPATNTFLSGTAAVSMASLISIINDGTPAGASTDTVKAIAVGTDGANFELRAAGTDGNTKTIAKVGVNIVVNTATFSGGSNSALFVVNLPTLSLKQFPFLGATGVGVTPLPRDGLSEVELITWLGLLEVRNPNGIAIIKNIG